MPRIVNTREIYTLSKDNSFFSVRSKGCFSSWKVNGRDVLYSNPDNPKRSTHPCGPIFGAVSTDAAVKDNQQYSLGKARLTMPQHGFLRTGQWTAVRYNQLNHPSVPSILVLELTQNSNHFNKEIWDQYPFFFKFVSAYQMLGQNKIFHQLSFTNLSPTNAPLDLASHTYHPWVNGIKVVGLQGLKYRDETDWANIKQKTGHAQELGDNISRNWHFETSRSEGKNIKHHDQFILLYPDTSAIKLKFNPDISETYDVSIRNLVLWTEPKEGDFICLEPVARERNSFNKGTHLSVPSGLSASISYYLEYLPPTK